MQPGHNCRAPTFNIIKETEFHDTAEELSENQGSEEVLKNENEEALVSLRVVIRGKGMNNIKLMGLVTKQAIVILVDNGSTHIFLDPKLLCQMKRSLEKAKTVTVTVTNGSQVIYDSVCSKLMWQIQTETCEMDFRLLGLAGYYMGLGMDLIDQFAPIKLHTKSPRISFHKEGKKVMLKGLAKKVKL